MTQPRLRRFAAREEAAAEPVRMRRNSSEVKAARAASLLDNPAFRESFDGLRDECIRDLELAELDGSEASERKVIELVRKLQSLITVKRYFLRPLVAEQMKAANADKARTT